MKEENIDLGFVVVGKYKMKKRVYVSGGASEFSVNENSINARVFNLSDAVGSLEQSRLQPLDVKVDGRDDSVSLGIHSVSADVYFEPLSEDESAKLRAAKKTIDEIEKMRVSGDLSERQAGALYNFALPSVLPALNVDFSKSASEMPDSPFFYVAAAKSEGAKIHCIKLSSNGCDAGFFDAPNKATHFSDVDTASRALRGLSPSLDLFIGKVFYTASENAVPEQEVNARLRQEALEILSPKSREFLLSRQP